MANFATIVEQEESVADVAGTFVNLTISRTHVQLTNNGSVPLWVKIVPSGAAGPTITAANRSGQLVAGETAILPYGNGIDIYVRASSGACDYVAIALIKDGLA